MIATELPAPPISPEHLERYLNPGLVPAPTPEVTQGRPGEVPWHDQRPDASGDDRRAIGPRGLHSRVGREPPTGLARHAEPRRTHAGHMTTSPPTPSEYARQAARQRASADAAGTRRRATYARGRASARPAVNSPPTISVQPRTTSAKGSASARARIAKHAAPAQSNAAVENHATRRSVARAAHVVAASTTTASATSGTPASGVMHRG